MNEKLPKKSVSNQIIDTAAVLFAVKGYDGVSIRELAKTAGVNNALISYYFGGKKELYSYILSTQLEILVSIVDQTQQEMLSPIETIYRFASRLLPLKKSIHI